MKTDRGDLIGPDGHSVPPERQAFLRERLAAAQRAQELISDSENDDDVESAIQFALEAMHDDQSKCDMLAWVCETAWGIDGRFIGVVLAEAHHRPKISGLVQWDFDADELVDLFALSDPRGLMSDDKDYAHWQALRRKRKPVTIWRGVRGITIEEALCGVTS